MCSSNFASSREAKSRLVTPWLFCKIRLELVTNSSSSQNLFRSAMKMESIVTSPVSGKVQRVAAAEGDSLSQGDLICHGKFRSSITTKSECSVASLYSRCCVGLDTVISMNVNRICCLVPLAAGLLSAYLHFCRASLLATGALLLHSLTLCSILLRDKSSERNVIDNLLD